MNLVEDKEVNNCTGCKKINPIKEFLGFNKDIRYYMMMHWIGGLFFSYTDILPVFMYKLGINVVQAGLLFSFTAIVDVILTFIFGKLLDKISPNVAMTFDWITESLPAFIFAFAGTYTQCFIGILTQKVTSVLVPSYKVYENEIFPEKDRSLIYTYHLFTPEIFSAIILPIVGYLLTYKFNTIFAIRVTFFICGIGFILTAIVPKKLLRQVEPFKIQKEKFVWNFPKGLYLVAAVEILLQIASQLTSLLITSYYILNKMNGTLLDVMLVCSVNSLVIIITGLISKNFTKKFSELKIAQFGIIFFVLYTGVMSISNSIILVLLANILGSMGQTIWFPSHSSIVMKLVPRDKRGLFFGTFSSISKIFSIIIPIVSAFIAKQFGFVYIFFIAFIIYVCIFFIYQVMLKKGYND